MKKMILQNNIKIGSKYPTTRILELMLILKLEFLMTSKQLINNSSSSSSNNNNKLQAFRIIFRTNNKIIIKINNKMSIIIILHKTINKHLGTIIIIINIDCLNNYLADLSKIKLVYFIYIYNLICLAANKFIR